MTKIRKKIMKCFPAFLQKVAKLPKFNFFVLNFKTVTKRISNSTFREKNYTFKRIPRGRVEWLAALLILLKVEIPWVIIYFIVVGIRLYIVRHVTDPTVLNKLLKKDFKSMKELKKYVDMIFLRIIAVLSMIFSYFFIM